MAISQTLKAFLDGAKVRYTVVKHPVAYTAQEIAAAQHVPGRQLAKCVLVKTDRGPVLAVLPAIHLIDLKKLKTLLRAKTLTIGKEADIKQRFPDVEVGAMSPFGNLYQVPVAVDRVLADAEQIVFNAGSHTETLKMGYADFARLVNPTAGTFAQQLKPSKKKSVKPKKASTRTGKRTVKRPGKKKSAARR